jgi:hypothetical protein
MVRLPLGEDGIHSKYPLTLFLGKELIGSPLLEMK